MRRKLWLIMVLALLVSGCGLMNSGGPSVCDDIAEPSVLCDLSDGAGVRLESAGNMLIIVNAIAIGEGAYTKAQALEVLTELRGLLDAPLMSYLGIRDKVEHAVFKYPGLFMVTEVYLQGFSSPQVIYNKDRRILTAWLDARIRSLK